MTCPNCDETLIMTERQGVEIDYCPKCRGVWLDKGELDKIIEKSSSAEASQLKSQYKNRTREDDDEDKDDGGFFSRNRDNEDKTNPNSDRRKGGFLENLFNFD